MCFTSNVNTAHVPGSRGARGIPPKQAGVVRENDMRFCTNLPSNSTAALYWWQLGGAEGYTDIQLSWSTPQSTV